jgi:hypothetical protein
MSDTIFEDHDSFDVEHKHDSLGITVLNEIGSLVGNAVLETGRKVIIRCEENSGWNRERACIVLSSDEATKMKEFLIKQGY